MIEYLNEYSYRCLICGRRFFSLALFSPAFHEHAEHCDGIDPDVVARLCEAS